MTKQIFYDTNDLELVKSRLQGILTISEVDAANLAKRTYQDEVLAVAKVFNRASETLHRKWTTSILGNVPPEAWEVGAHGEEQVIPTKESSLRLWSPETSESQKENSRIGHVRQQIFSELFESMLPYRRKLYGPMMRWIVYPSEAPVQLAESALGSDTFFGHVIALLERWHDLQLQEYEKAWLRRHQWPRDETIPSAQTQAMSCQALDHLKLVLAGWLEVEAKENRETPDSLLALISANLSANRVLIEFAALEARGREAAGLAIGIVEKLNSFGIAEIPACMFLDPPGALLRLKALLTDWFGPRGLLIGPDSIFQRPMNHSDIDLTMKWSLQLQVDYIGSRGRRGGSEEALENHGKPMHLFIFALTLVGAYYGNAKTDNEFKGKSNSSYAVFPGRKLISKGVSEAPPPHAAALLKQAYGLIFFGNSGWNIAADGVRNYASVCSVKRSHIQQLVRFAIKNRPSSVLLELNQRLSEMKENPPLDYDQAKPH
ncbi:hypothetical protein [Pseudomonas helleri]|uniref:hypothetical protein n=1 Tax=Pseudomonas helleri TaxID=1608996 RepID=UPI0021C89DA4|nr:hypothetical protein [Pseudomonas helleri]MCU1754696.1 hypothetical protein [Pseudomonas helleri]